MLNYFQSFVFSNFDLYYVSVTAVMYAISCYVVPRYNGTRLYMGYTNLLTMGAQPQQEKA